MISFTRRLFSLNDRKLNSLEKIDLLYLSMSNYRWLLRKTPDFDPLGEFYSAILRSQEQYLAFKEQFDGYFSRSNPTLSLSNIQSEFINYCQNNNIEHSISVLVWNLFNSLFWKRLIPIEIHHDKISSPAKKTNPEWRVSVTADDVRLFRGIVKNTDLLETFKILLRSQVYLRADGTTGTPQQQDEVTSGGDPHFFKQIVNAVFEHIDNLVRNNSELPDEERGRLGNVDELFNWYKLENIPLLKRYKPNSGGMDKIRAELHRMGFLSRLCHAPPTNDTPCSESEDNQFLWIKLPRILKSFVTDNAYSFYTLSLALIIHGFTRSLVERDYNSIWIANVAIYFAIMVLVERLNKLSDSQPEMRHLISRMNSNSSEFSQLVFGIGLLFSSEFSSGSVFAFRRAFNREEKISEFIAYNASGVIFTSSEGTYRIPQPLEHEIASAYKSVWDVYSKYDVEYDA